MELRRIQKSGNSYYVTLPKAFLDYLGISLKDYVLVTLEKKRIKIEKVTTLIV